MRHDRIPDRVEEASVAEAGLRRVPISILDLSPVSSGGTPTEALQSTIGLAQHAEALGYTRFWVAEHHNHPGIASSSPAVLIAAVAGATRTIRVGSGGVMLPNHPPLVVAEQFGTLEGVYPGRIDLGIGRAPGTDPITARALRRSVDGLTDEDFPQQLADLIGFLRGGLPDDHPLAPIRSVPRVDAVPPIWLLGSSGYSAQVAGMLGLPFGFAHHFSARNTIPALDLYRRSFRPSAVLAEPYALVAVRALIAETDDEAEWLAGSSALSFLRLSQGRPGPVPTPQEAADHAWTDDERAVVADRRAGQAVGSPDTVRQYFDELLHACGANELMVTTLAHDSQVRVDTYTQVARIFGPTPLVGLDGHSAIA